MAVSISAACEIPYYAGDLIGYFSHVLAKRWRAVVLIPFHRSPATNQNRRVR